MWDNNKCPACNAANETLRHVLTCPNVEMTDEFAAAVEVLELWMMEKDTCPEIMDCTSTALAMHQVTSFQLLSAKKC